MTDRTLKAKVNRLQELQAEIDALTAQADSLKDQIKAEMTTRAVDELKAGNTVVRWKPVVSNRFDSNPKPLKRHTAACTASLPHRLKPAGSRLFRRKKRPYTPAIQSKV